MDKIDDFIAQAHRLIAEASQISRQPGELVRSLSSPTNTTVSSRPGHNPVPSVLISPTRPSFSTSPLRTPVSSSRNLSFSPRSSPASDDRRLLSLGRMPTDSAISSSLKSTDVLDRTLVPDRLSRNANLHARLIRDVRPNVLDDFELLFKMLTLDDIVGTALSASSTSELDLTNCAPYAVAVLTQTIPLLRSLGPQICELLTKQRGLQTWAPNLVKDLDAYVAASRHSSGNDPVHKRISHNQVPFREETDSKHNFKTAEQKRLYDNRERVRDAFLTNLNRVISSQNEISSYYSVDDEELNRKFRECVQSILPENLAWFARLFVQHLLNVSGDDREFDKDVKTWAANHVKRGTRGTGNGIDRINKLSRRMDGGVNPIAPSAPPPPFMSPASGFQPRAPSPVPQTPTSQRYSTAVPAVPQVVGGSVTSSSAGDWWEDLFPRPAERFFPLFLYVADSHALCLNVQQCCLSTLQKLSFPTSNNSAVKDDLGFAERLASCNVLAKFLGFLTHYPRFASTKIALENRSSSSAFESLYQESVEESTRNGPLGLDARQMLARAAESRCVTLVVPWLARYLLAGPARDFGAREAPYMTETFVMLGLIRKSLLVKEAIRNGKGFGQLRVVAEIDSLFQEFGVSLDAIMNSPEADMQSDRWEALWLETDLSQSVDGMHVQFDGVPLDRVATTCVPLERLRQLLLSAATLSANAVHLAGKSKLRRISAETPARKVAPTVMTELAPRPHTFPIGNTFSAPSITLLQEQQCKQIIVETFLHHEEEVARVVDFALQMAPPNVLMQTGPLVQKFVADAIPHLGDHLDLLADLEGDVLERLMCRVYYNCRDMVENLVEMSLGHKSMQFRESVVEVAVGKVELAIEKLLRRKLSDVFTQEKERLEKERERAVRAAFAHQTRVNKG